MCIRDRPISAYNVSTVSASEKSSIIANRKSTNRFPTSYRWNPYVTPNFPKGWLIKANLPFENKFPYISVIDEASDFQFGVQLGLPRPIIKSHQKKKLVWPWAWRAPKNLKITCNISATTGATDFKYCMSCGLPRAIMKSHQKENVGVTLGQGSSSNCGGSSLI